MIKRCSAYRGGTSRFDNVCESIRNLGRVGIPVLGRRTTRPSFVWRNGDNAAPLGRYGAKVQAFDLALQQQGIDDMADFGQRRDVKIPNVEALWENFEYFMRRVIPVAEEYGVTVWRCILTIRRCRAFPALRVCSSGVDSYKRAEQMIKSPKLGIAFAASARSPRWKAAQRIFMRRLIISARASASIYAHMRDVQGTVPKFHECFLGEGNFDPFEVIYALKHSGFDGFIVSDHVPAIEGDTTWGHRVRYADTGYTRGLMEAIDKMEARQAGRRPVR